jgi:hypothetical protein
MLYRPGQVILVGVGSIRSPIPAMPSRGMAVTMGERFTLAWAAGGGPAQRKERAETAEAT